MPPPKKCGGSNAPKAKEDASAKVEKEVDTGNHEIKKSKKSKTPPPPKEQRVFRHRWAKHNLKNTIVPKEVPSQPKSGGGHNKLIKVEQGLGGPSAVAEYADGTDENLIDDYEDSYIDEENSSSSDSEVGNNNEGDEDNKDAVEVLPESIPVRHAMGSNPNGRNSGRRLIPWHRERMAEKLILIFQYELHHMDVKIPYDLIAHRLNPGASGGALKQYLSKLRDVLVVEGHMVPPALGKNTKKGPDGMIRGFVRDMESDNPTTTRPVDWREPYTHPQHSIQEPGVVRGSGNYSRFAKTSNNDDKAVATPGPSTEREPGRTQNRRSGTSEPSRTPIRRSVEPSRHSGTPIRRNGTPIHRNSTHARHTMTPIRRSAPRRFAAMPKSKTQYKDESESMADEDDDEMDLDYPGKEKSVSVEDLMENSMPAENRAHRPIVFRVSPENLRQLESRAPIASASADPATPATKMSSSKVTQKSAPTEAVEDSAPPLFDLGHLQEDQTQNDEQGMTCGLEGQNLNFDNIPFGPSYGFLMANPFDANMYSHSFTMGNMGVMGDMVAASGMEGMSVSSGMDGGMGVGMMSGGMAGQMGYPGVMHGFPQMYGTSPGYGNAFGHTGFQQSYVGPVPAGDHALGAAIESSSEEILAAVNPNLRPDAQQENPSDESEFSDPRFASSQSILVDNDAAIRA